MILYEMEIFLGPLRFVFNYVSSAILEYYYIPNYIFKEATIILTATGIRKQNLPKYIIHILIIIPVYIYIYVIKNLWFV